MTLEEFLAAKGKTIGTSDWLAITQADIDVFGGVTKDMEPMHNDPKWCAENSPFGTTIAYGFKTISMLTDLMHSATTSLFSGSEGVQNFPLNYGFNKMRLISPVKVNDRIRARIDLVDTLEKKPGELLMTLDVTVEIDGGTRPALRTEWLVYWISDEGRNSVKRSLGRDKTQNLDHKAAQ